MAAEHREDWLMRVVKSIAQYDLAAYQVYLAQMLVIMVGFVEILEEEGKTPDREWAEATLLDELGVTVRPIDG